MKTVKATTTPNNKLRYCPAYLAGKKKGRPKKDIRHPSVADHIAKSAAKKRKRKKKLYCKICEKFNHNTDECFKNPANQQRPQAEEIIGDMQEGSAD